ncbi:MAG: gluconate kinase [Chloroflexi bacterium HGW-Chloroflexi-4]|nr:MAG: gluconate kinase [Chloroflexi bacterium HGW-Chloroflexi-4]
MGVSGSGKSAVGQSLASKLGWDFYDADDFHPSFNIEKMASGAPLTDEDRLPWLDSLHAMISKCLKEKRNGVLACSALKEKYRQQLLFGNQNIQLVYLRGSFDLILSRMAARSEHYMKPAMLQSQFEILEEPKNGLVVDINQSVEEIVEKIILLS